MKKEKSSVKQSLTTTLLLILLALASVTAATAAWFSIATNTKVKSMAMDLTSGVSLRFDLDKHDSFEEYTNTLSFADIKNRILMETGTDISGTPLEPVTTDDGIHYTFENGDPADSDTGVYVEFVLHFIAQKDMYVHLTSADGTDEDDKGTLIYSDNPALADSMRISFDDGNDYVVYDPELGDTRINQEYFAIIGIPQEQNMQYNSNNTLFFLQADTDTPVTVRVWLEGTDELCDNDLIGEQYELRLRFEGTDSDNNPFDTKQD